MGGGGAAALQKDVPWRAAGSGARPIPKIHHSPILCLPQNPYSDYALSIMKVRFFLPLFLLLTTAIYLFVSVLLALQWKSLSGNAY